MCNEKALSLNQLIADIESPYVNRSISGRSTFITQGLGLSHSSPDSCDGLVGREERGSCKKHIPCQQLELGPVMLGLGNSSGEPWHDLVSGRLHSGDFVNLSGGSWRMWPSRIIFHASSVKGEQSC